MTFKEAIGQLRCNVEGDYINLDDLEAFNLAIPALEKQIPKKPLDKKLVDDGYRWQWICPNCHTIKTTTEKSHCDDCGQALDWGDTE